jgi:hypothetical protein
MLEFLVNFVIGSKNKNSGGLKKLDRKVGEIRSIFCYNK